MGSINIIIPVFLRWDGVWLLEQENLQVQIQPEFGSELQASLTHLMSPVSKKGKQNKTEQNSNKNNLHQKKERKKRETSKNGNKIAPSQE